MSECGVCISGDCDGLIDNYEAKIIKSRKDHKCLECRRSIMRGAECERSSGLWEGKWFAEHTCLDCMNIREGLRCEGPCVHGELWEQVGEVFDMLTTGCLSKIETASAKAYLLQRWRKWKGLAA